MKESGEDYLETVRVLQYRNGVVRSVDVASEMNVSKASVSVAMKTLRQSGYVRMGEKHEIYLTAKGRTLAETVYERHLLFSEILTRLGVEEKTALRDACHMEHAMSAESFEALKEHFIKYEADLPLPEKGDVYECSDRGRKRGDDGAV